MSNISKLITTDEEKAKVLNNIFASVFTGNCSSYNPQVDGSEDRNWGSNVHPSVSEDQIHDQLKNPNICKSMGPVIYIPMSSERIS